MIFGISDEAREARSKLQMSKEWTERENTYKKYAEIKGVKNWVPFFTLFPRRLQTGEFAWLQMIERHREPHLVTVDINNGGYSYAKEIMYENQYRRKEKRED